MLFYRIAALLGLAGVFCAPAADWLNQGGDPQHTNWQKREKSINAATVPGLKPIWKRPLAGAAFSSPVIMGRLVTHRGTVELVFVLSNSGDLYAVDGDFGTVFWKRHFEGSPPSSCQLNDVPTPVLTPPAADYNEDEDDDVPQPLRPLYVLSSDGILHAVHPGLGTDLGTWKLLEPGVRASSLDLIGSNITVSTYEGCGGHAGAWSIDVSDPHSRPQARPIEHGHSRLEASWESDGASWTASIRNGRVTAFQPPGKPAWTSKALAATTPPVVAGGFNFCFRTGRPAPSCGVIRARRPHRKTALFQRERHSRIREVHVPRVGQRTHLLCIRRGTLLLWISCRYLT